MIYCFNQGRKVLQADGFAVIRCVHSCKMFSIICITWNHYSKWTNAANARCSIDLLWLDLNRGHQDNSPGNGHERRAMMLPVLRRNLTFCKFMKIEWPGCITNGVVVPWISWKWAIFAHQKLITCMPSMIIVIIMDLLLQNLGNGAIYVSHLHNGSFSHNKAHCICVNRQSCMHKATLNIIVRRRYQRHSSWRRHLSYIDHGSMSPIDVMLLYIFLTIDLLVFLTLYGPRFIHVQAIR